MAINLSTVPWDSHPALRAAGFGTVTEAEVHVATQTLEEVAVPKAM